MISPVVLTVLRIVLTAGLIILFLIIMYRKLLRKMKMRIPEDKFGLLLSAEWSASGSHLTLEIDLPVRDKILIQITDAKGTQQTLFDGEKDKGTHTMTYEVPAMVEGPFTLRFITSNHRTDRLLGV